MNEKDNYILKLDHIEKSFPGVKALKDITMYVEKGEVRGLVGENGAGKSTMMKVLTGIIPMNSGQVTISGEAVTITSPLHAQKLGLSIIFQEFNLVNSLSIAENIFVGRLPIKGIQGIQWKTVYKNAKKLLDRVGLNVDPTAKAGSLSVAGKQMVEIAKALSHDSKIIIMDEPSATLTDNELKNLFRIIDDLKKEGVTVIYISHRLDEIFRLCDNVTIIRDGEVIETCPTKALTKEQIIVKMVGRSMNQEYPDREGKPTEEPVLEVRSLYRKGVFEDISFCLHKGERLGIAGLVGAGRTEIVRAIFGADKLSSGEVLLHGKPTVIHSPMDAIAKKIAFVTEDRKTQGLVLESSVAENTTMAALKKICSRGFLNRKKETEVAADYVETLKTKTSGTKTKVLNLSGGNQQKVVLAKWLYTDAEVLILDEPTRGIDVGAKYEIYQLINQLADSGKAVIVISSELPEVINMSDRLLVIHDGKCKGELSGDEKTAENIMKHAILEEVHDED